MIIQPQPTLPTPPADADGFQAYATALNVAIQTFYADIAARLEESILQGTVSQRPPAGGLRKLYYATEQDKLYYDDGVWSDFVEIQITSRFEVLLMSHMVPFYFAWKYASLQLAIDAAEANGGGIVICDAVTYNESIAIGSPFVAVLGVPGKTTINGGTSAALTITADYTVIRDLILTTTGGGAHTLVIFGPDYVDIENVNVASVSGRAINVGATAPAFVDHLTVRDMYIDNSDGHALFLSRVRWPHISNVHANVFDALFIYADANSLRVRIEGCSCPDANASAWPEVMRLEHDYGTVTGCTMGQGGTGTPRTGTATAGSSNLNVVGNNFDGAFSDAGTGNVFQHN